MTWAPVFCRKFARDILYWSAEMTGRLRSREASLAGALTVLTYHRVLPDAEAHACPFPALAMPVSWFRSQMTWLRRKARVLPLSRALDDLGAASNDPRPRVAVTFDDGYFDNFEYAAPVLLECGLKATFFVCTTPVRNASHLWYDSIAEGTFRWGADGLKRSLGRSESSGSHAHSIVAALKREPDRLRRAAVEDVEKRLGGDAWTYRSHVMTVEQIQSLASAGHEIGSHTETHPILTQMEAPEAARELRDSKSWLEKTIGATIPGFCYPNGDHSPATREWVAQAGYSYACLTEEGNNPPGVDRFRIRRIDMAPYRVGNSFNRWSERSFRATLSLLRRRA